MVIGIDYGSKLAGTTAICFRNENNYQILQSKKNQDADIFILELLASLQPEVIGIDAPLSIPMVLRNEKTVLKHDYFYREADRQLKAMSPMFLGGLTARAMKLKYQILSHYPMCKVIEVYPKALIDTLYNKEYYNKKNKQGIAPFISSNEELFPLHNFKSWHAVDSYLAYHSAIRHRDGKAVGYGNENEGIIWV